MGRHLFSVLSALSLLLSVATATLWVRSCYWVDDWIGHLGQGHYALLSMKGLVGLHWEPDYKYRPDYYGLHSESLWYGPVDAGFRGGRHSAFGRLDDNAVWAFLGFSFSRHTSGNPQHCWRVSAPDWSLLGVMLVLPLCHFIGWRIRRRKHALGLCPKCGYDLRASPDRCPECGTPVPAGLVRRPIQ